MQPLIRVLAILLLACTSVWAGSTVVVVGQPVAAAGPTLLLGLSDLPANNATLNADTAYANCQTGQANGTVAHAYVYHRLASSVDPVHVCIWNKSTKALVGASPAITMSAGAGWKTVDWSGPTISTGTEYVIGVVGDGSIYTLWDETSPTLPGITPEAQTYGSEGSLASSTCGWVYGSFPAYVTD